MRPSLPGTFHGEKPSHCHWRNTEDCFKILEHAAWQPGGPRRHWTRPGPPDPGPSIWEAQTCLQKLALSALRRQVASAPSLFQGLSIGFSIFCCCAVGGLAHKPAGPDPVRCWRWWRWGVMSVWTCADAASTCAAAFIDPGRTFQIHSPRRRTVDQPGGRRPARRRSHITQPADVDHRLSYQRRVGAALKPQRHLGDRDGFANETDLRSMTAGDAPPRTPSPSATHGPALLGMKHSSSFSFFALLDGAHRLCAFDPPAGATWPPIGGHRAPDAFFPAPL